MIRHSALPKLAACPCFEGAPGTSEAAERGTRLDGLFRALVQRDELPGGLPQEDADAVRWAAVALRELANGHPVEVDKERCKARTPGIEHIGEMDALCLGGGFHADLKSGQIRNYCEQMAAYALAMMEQHFLTEWTAYLLFCDQREVVRHRFTYHEAQSIVRAVLRAANDDARKPNVCEYCTWCAKATTCPARTDAVESALATQSGMFDAILADSGRLGDFLTKCKILDDFREVAETKARELLESGGAVDGWKLRKGRESQIVFPDAIGRHIKQLGFGRVLDAYGAMSKPKFEKLWKEALPNEPIPDGIFVSKPATKPSLVQA